MFTLFCFFFKQKTAYEMRISDWSSDVCSSDLVDMAVADPMLQRDAPLPASAVRRRAGHRQHRLYRRAGHCQRPIARQPVRPVLIANTKCVADQQDRKSVGMGKRMSEREDHGGRPYIKKQKQNNNIFKNI